MPATRRRVMGSRVVVEEDLDVGARERGDVGPYPLDAEMSAR